jgi:hypothetical protein
MDESFVQKAIVKEGEPCSRFGVRDEGKNVSKA